VLVQRVLSAAVLVPLIVAATVAGGAWFVGIVVAASAVALWEFYTLLRQGGHHPLWPFGFVLGAAFLLDASTYPGRTVPPVLALSLILSLLYLVVRQRVEQGLGDWALTWVPPLYVAFLASFLISLRLLPFGDRWVFLVAGVTWSTDVAAYFVGTAVGKHKFFSRVSPHKTQEGALGGLVAGVVASILLAWVFGWDPMRFAAFGLLASVAAEGGDLAESLMKRQLRAKDAGRLIPGHGGMLDRLDSLLFVGVVTYFWAVWVGVGL
jgi:phosphatidate cytidylyltransferase